MFKRIIIISASLAAGLILLRSLSATMLDEQFTRQVSAAETVYTIVDLGTLGGTNSEATAINEQGQIVGSSTLSGDLSVRAFVWESGVLSGLLTAENQNSLAYDIDDGGLIAGEVISGESSSDWRQPALWLGDVFTPLQTISLTHATARAIGSGQLVAGHTISPTSNEIILWENSLLSATVPFTGGIGSVNALSVMGQIVGSISGTQSQQAYMWHQDVFTDLLTLGGSNSVAWDINDQSQIVGSATTTDDLTSRAVSWQDDQISELTHDGHLLSGPSEAKAINNHGDIVGQAEISGQLRAVLWQDGQMIDLHSLLPSDTDWEQLIVANDINDKGWIVGMGRIAGEQHAFLLFALPPEPAKNLYLPFIVGSSEAPPVPTPQPSPTPTPLPDDVFDMQVYMTGDGRLYEVRHSAGSQARHQTQLDGKRFFHTKGNEVKAEWEELWYSDDDISRGTDTSPGNDQYYTLYENGVVGSSWAPRYWKVGDIYERNPLVVFYRKSDCRPTVSGTSRTWLRFEAFYPQYTFQSGIKINNVVKLAWLLHPQGQPEENYFYAEDYGLVGWGSASHGFSYVSELHANGSRPNNKREVIPCLNQSGLLQLPNSALSFKPLPLAYQLLVK